MILICYDGSDDAKAAIERAGVLFNGDPAIVLTIWEPFAELISRTPAATGAIGITDFERIDDSSERGAEATADEGAERARSAGLDATGIKRAQSHTIAQAILDQADVSDADAIVLGSRGLTGVGSLLMGSVSHAVLQSADRPVLVVPSPAIADERTRKRHERSHRS
jgi:nucleotide-binding universal stress UspA family protein